MESGVNRFDRLKWQIVFVNMGFVAALMIALLVAIYALMNRQMEQQSISVLNKVIGEDNTVTPYGLIQEKEGIEIPYFTVELRNDGRAAFIDGQYTTTESLSQIQDMTKIVLDSEAVTGWVDGYPFRYMKTDGDSVTRISFVDCSYENNLRSSLLWSLIVLGLCVMIVFALLSYFFAGWIVKPLEDTWKRQKQFVADASHELKTPLTVILANSELLLRACPEEKQAERRWLGNIYEESKNMKILILEMLALARKDAVLKENKKFQKINIIDVLQNAILQFEPVYYQNSRRLIYQIPEEEILVNGNEESLMQVIKILLDNAIKYSYSDSITRISVRKTYRNIWLQKIMQFIKRQKTKNFYQAVDLVISNEGAGMTAIQCKDIFKRFYRLDAARSDENGNGFGLGLSIASEIVAEHKGKIWAESSDGWNHFYIHLRVAT